MIDANYPALSATIAGSMLWRTGNTVIDALVRAWPGSLTARCLAALTPVRGLSAVAGIGAIAASVAFATQFALPVYVRSGLPVMWPIAAIALLVVVAVSASAFERAWPHSTTARLLVAPRRRP